MSAIPARVARLDPTLRARLEGGRPLLYADGGAPGDDRPAHVRAASAIRTLGARLVVVQDDVNVLAVVEGDRTGAVLLPLGEGGRRTFGDDLGNKKAKMDLEACVVLPDGRLCALGSGSTAARDRVVLLGDDGAPRVVDAAPLYARLRETTAFSGSELNVEGAVVIGDRLRLFQRGNGAPRGELLPVNATCDLDLDAFVAFLAGRGPAPAPRDVTVHDLGLLEGAPLGFTDAAALPDGRIAFLACAEASPDTFRDGAVLGCRFGVIDAREVRVADVIGADGAIATTKLEGLEPSRPPDRWRVVADRDRPDEPALLADLIVEGT